MRLLLAALALLTACSRDFTVPEQLDRTPPTLSRFTVSPPFAKEGATLSLSFDSSEDLPAAARSPNPEVTFAGQPMACSASGLVYTCTIAVTAAMGEGPHDFSVVASDAAHNLRTVESAASAVLDFSAPHLAVSETPAPAIKGAATSFVVDSDEPLGALPSITAAFLSGSPVCAGAVPGSRFVCTGASVDSAAAAGTATFTVSGEDRAGNAATAQGSVAIQNPILPAPHVTVTSASPDPAKPGETVTFSLQADQPLDSCAASVGGLIADCHPDGATCPCSFVVSSSLIDGETIVLGFATNANGTGSGSTGIAIDQTAPRFDVSKLTTARHPTGTDDGVAGAVGAVIDALSYPAAMVVAVNLWAAQTGGTPLGTVVPAPDGSFPETALQATDGADESRLSPPLVWISATDLAGNESDRISIPDGADLPGSGNTDDVVIVRHDLTVPDGVRGQAGALQTGACAVRKVLVFDNNDPDFSNLLTEGPANDDGSFDELPVGDELNAPPFLFVKAVSKCGTEGDFIESGVGEAVAPSVDATAMTILRRDFSALDGVVGGTGSATASVCTLVAIQLFAPTDLYNPVATGPVGPGGSFVEIPFGTTQQSLASVLVGAVDKCGAQSTQGKPIAGLDTGPVVDGAKLSLVTSPAGSTVSAVTGAVQASQSVLREVDVYDLPATGQTLLAGPFSPAADGSFASRALGAGFRPRVWVAATDKAGVTAIAASRSVQAAIDLAGRVPGAALPTPAMAWPVAGDVDPRSTHPGVGPARAPELSGAALTALSSLDGATAATASSSDAGGTPQAAQLPFPNGRFGSPAVYDSVHQKLVAFGGADSVDQDETWEFDGAAWLRRLPAHKPSPRRGHGMAWDGTQVILFGGESGTSTFFNDTWSWDGTDWTQLFPTHAPTPARGYMAMGRLGAGVAFFGGVLAGQSHGADTWVFSGGDWTQAVSASGPPGRSFATLSWDGQRALLFGGGTDTSNSGTNDLWAFNGTWTQISTAHQPPTRNGHCAAFDPVRSRLVIAGGSFSSGQTWEFDGSDWSQRAQAFPPYLRTLCGMDFFPPLNKPLLFGGSNGYGGGWGDVWSWDGTTWSAVSAAPDTRSRTAVAYDLARDRLISFGGEIGSFYTGETWEFDGQAWTRADAGLSRIGIADAAIAYDTDHSRALLFGGIDLTGFAYAFTQLWAGGPAWTSLTFSAAQRPPARSASAMVFDTLRGKAVLFGGRASPTSLLNDTWEFDGQAWTQIATATHPPARAQHALAYDAARGRTVLTGGVNASGTSISDTWVYDGTDWTSTSASPGAISQHSMVWDPQGMTVVLFGGSDGAGNLNGNVLSYAGGSSPWSLSGLTAPPRLDAKLVWDAKRARTMWFGGTLPAVSGSVPRYSELWSASLPFAHERLAGQVFLFPLDAQAQVQSLSVQYTGGGAGPSASGLELVAWNWATESWNDLGSNSALPAAPQAVTAVFPSAIGNYVRGGRVWIMAVAPAPSDSGTASTVATDYVKLNASYTLP